MILLGLYCFKEVAAQDIFDPISPSPTAASLGQYADIPVSNYTGIPSIAIPLFDIQSGQISLPVTLTYHASGIRVAQEASWVGLGWALNAGGVITRQVNGGDDLQVTQGNGLGYLRSPMPPATEFNLPDWSNTDSINSYTETYDLINSLYYDGQPDIFYYNFLSYSGKLVFKKQGGNEITATSIDQNNLIFKYNISAKQWIVTDGNGWKYYLGAADEAIETTRDYNVSADHPFASDALVEIAIDMIPDMDKPDPVITAWYLTKIVTPQGDEMEFLYEHRGETIGQIYYSETLHNLLDVELIHHSGGASTTLGSYTPVFYFASRQVTRESYLREIHFKNGKLAFACTDRKDLLHNDSDILKPGRLSTIQLYNPSGEILKKVEFTHSYFNASRGTDKLRLRLDAVQESGGLEQIPPYTFSYNTTSLPAKSAYSSDYWGYFNGQNNDRIFTYQWLGERDPQSPVVAHDAFPGAARKMFVPAYYAEKDDESIRLEGANREVSPAHIQAATLTGIRYPTGGAVEFEYEPNVYYTPDNDIYDYRNAGFASVTDRGDDTATNGATREFTLSNYCIVKFYFSLEGDANAAFNFSTATVQTQSGLDILSIYEDVNLDDQGKFEFRAEVLLAPGTYRLKAQVAEPDYANIIAFISAQWYEDVLLVSEKYGAGIRVKSVTTKDAGQVVKKRKYTYEENELSSGRLISPDRFFYNYQMLTQWSSIRAGSVSIMIWLSDQLARSSGSFIPLGNSAQGNSVGYNQVIVSDVDQNDNSLGSSTYYYENIPEVPSELFMPGVPNSTNLSNGQLLTELHLNHAGDTVKIRNIEYTKNNQIESVKGVRLFKLGDNTEIRFYDLFSEWWHPAVESETVYDLQGQNPVTTVTYYTYGNPAHKNLTETRQQNSKGEWLVTTHTYPPDLTVGLDEMPYAVIDSMVNVDHVINPILKTETTLDSVLVNGTITNYTRQARIDTANVTHHMYLPSVVKQLKKGTSQYEKNVEYVAYDSAGRLLEVLPRAGVPICYIWGYNKAYPVAKIENATYAQVASYVANIQNTSNQDDDHCLGDASCHEQDLRTALNALRSALPDAMITTYTYDPGRGITSITDVNGEILYYEYDDLGRLQWLVDDDHYRVRRIDYNYQY